MGDLKLILTTSREPSRRTRSFLKELALAVPHGVKVNRGKATFKDLYNLVLREGAYGVLVVFEKKANPSALVYYVPKADTLERVFLMKIRSPRLRRELRDSQKPLNIRNLVIRESSYSSKESEEVANALVEALKPRIAEGGYIPRSIEILITGSEQPRVDFICVDSGKICGPSFNVEKVIWYGEQGDQG